MSFLSRNISFHFHPIWLFDETRLVQRKSCNARFVVHSASECPLRAHFFVLPELLNRVFYFINRFIFGLSAGIQPLSRLSIERQALHSTSRILPWRNILAFFRTYIGSYARISFRHCHINIRPWINHNSGQQLILLLMTVCPILVQLEHLCSIE